MLSASETCAFPAKICKQNQKDSWTIIESVKMMNIIPLEQMLLSRLLCTPSLNNSDPKVITGMRGIRNKHSYCM